MAAIRAQVILKTVDGVSENFVTNSWAFEASSPVGADTELTVLLKDFYDDISGFLSPNLAQNNHEIKFYSLPGSPPNYPYNINTFNLAAAPAGTAMPDECAVVLSFQGVKSAGFPQNRRRGRVYIGPLDNTASGSGGLVNAPLPTALANAATTLAAGIAISTYVDYWGVWSVTDQELVEVADGWIDNAWDTQRRRGRDATVRTTFVV